MTAQIERWPRPPRTSPPAPAACREHREVAAVAEQFRVHRGGLGLDRGDGRSRSADHRVGARAGRPRRSSNWFRASACRPSRNGPDQPVETVTFDITTAGVGEPSPGEWSEACRSSPRPPCRTVLRRPARSRASDRPTRCRWAPVTTKNWVPEVPGACLRLGHCDDARDVLSARRRLLDHRVAGAAVPLPSGSPPWITKPGDDPVEVRPSKKPFDEGVERVGGLRGLLGVEGEIERATIRRPR